MNDGPYGYGRRQAPDQSQNALLVSEVPMGVSLTCLSGALKSCDQQLVAFGSVVVPLGIMAVLLP